MLNGNDHKAVISALWSENIILNDINTLLSILPQWSTLFKFTILKSIDQSPLQDDKYIVLLYFNPDYIINISSPTFLSASSNQCWCTLKTLTNIPAEHSLPFFGTPCTFPNMLITHKNTVTYSVEICYYNRKHSVYPPQAQCAQSTCNFSLAPPAR
jgi:hypothetical protein